ncbi:hypothetical protein LSH36_543g05008 [Paralvinella palmiformis]|uniref:Endonuclease/exonuclease/phosphatase domain-containing protein n=1 Tax=Paralvinella palmiformis TaxID=53620 RepID=A0AAD9MW52_9ANNE|nr:hypothetical protein LSH36_543g05008 [Paralvinella palmiformis]
MGDFSMQNMDWDSWNGTTGRGTEFIDLHQHSDKQTTYRHGQNPSLVDLLITNTGELVRDITYMDPLGKSDHLCISFCTDLEPEKNDSSQLRYKMYKGDYTMMMVKLEKVNRKQDTTHLDVEQTWGYFKNIRETEQ